MLKMYSAPISPFAARVRMALAHKGIEWQDLGIPDPAAPDHGLKTPAYLAINPIGKIPVLILDDGTAIVESETILDYLEDACPERPLLPADPLARVRMRSVIRALESYVCPSLFRLFGQLDPATRVALLADTEIGRMREGLGFVARFTDDAPFACDGIFTLADCVLFPTLHLCRGVAGLFGVEGDILAATPALAGYYEKARAHPLMGGEEAQMDEAAKSYGR